MVAAVDTRSTQAAVINVLAGKPDVRLTLGAVFVLYNHPAATLRTTQVANVVVVKSTPDIKTTQATVVVLWKGRTERRKVRAWGFSQDGHDFYVLRLGETMTLVYDLTTQQWSKWENPGLNVLRAHLGLNWTGQAKTSLDAGYAWNVIGGDDNTGILWNLDPTVEVDDDVNGVDTSFERQVVGQYPMRLRDTAQCGAVYVLANLGSPVLTAEGVTLETSDDLGYNWINHGTVTIESGNTSQEVGWIGLGVMTSPGRIFRITDTGAFARISSMDIRP